MNQIRTLNLIFFFFIINELAAVETCSRVAIINYQEVLVDTSSNRKGEGLRFYLEKDKTANSYLDKYQEGTKIKLENALMGTVGTSMILGGILSNAQKTKKQSLLIGGATLMILNFLVAKTRETSNEKNLEKAVEEYNKRNIPKIYFNPEESSNRNLEPGVSFFLQKSWSF